MMVFCGVFIVLLTLIPFYREETSPESVVFGHYAVLEGREVRRVTDVLEWANRFDRDGRGPLWSTYSNGYLISTIFLGMNHGFHFGRSRPLWFETMIFKRNPGEDPSEADWSDRFCDRYSTYADAEEGHYNAVAYAFNTLPAA